MDMFNHDQISYSTFTQSLESALKFSADP